MARFSPSDAALEGFRVLREHWRVVVGWSIFNVVALLALSVLGAVVSFGAAAASSAGAVTFSGAFGALLASLGEAFTTAIIAGGLFRLMLRPEEPGYLHLRIGMDEVRILGVWLALTIAAFLLLGVCAALVVAGRGIGPLAAIGAWFVVAGVGAWLGLRVSLSAVASFAERRFAFHRSWRLTRGHSASLLGMAVLSLTLILLIGLLVGMVIFVAMSFGVGLGAMMEATFSDNGLADHPWVYVAELGAQLALFPAFLVLMLSPWVAAYQAFAGETAPA